MTAPPLFWLIAFVLALSVLAALVWPLVRRRKDEAPGDEAAAIAVFRDHKRQLDAEFAARTLSAAERDAAEAELVARFGTELAVIPADVVHTSERSRWIAAIVLVALVPASAALLYAFLGNPAAVNAPAASQEAAGHPDAAITDPQIIAMVDRLAEKMKANPEDAKGWILLGRSYLKMGRYDDAVAALAEAAKRMPESAGLLTDQAEAIAMVQGGNLAGRPAQLLKRALVLDPEYPKAIAMSAAAAAERGDYDGAIALYTRLKALVPAESEQIDQVVAEIDAARKGAAIPGLTAAPAAAPAPSAAVPAPSAAASAGPATRAAEGVTGRVEIDPKLAAKVAPGDTLFIFARDPEGGRMPLAVMRGAASELPKSFALTDAMAMTPNNTISRAKSVVVEARLSKSGNATPQSGDLRGSTAPVKPGADKVRIVIDQIVP
jgi:cytochrome c-type biogenesis protein CcmH